MKSANNIVSHLRALPSLKKVHSQHCIEQTLLLLPPGIQGRIRFSYIKNDVLFFVFNHPGAKMEFDNIIKSIKAPLKEMMTRCNPHQHLTDIKAFVSHKSLAPPPVKIPTVVSFTEQSKANFENHFEDEKLHQMFEDIRKIIHDRNT